MVECSLMNLVVVGSASVAVTDISYIAPDLSKYFLDIVANADCVFILKAYMNNMTYVTHRVLIPQINLSKLFEKLIRKQLSEFLKVSHQNFSVVLEIFMMRNIPY